MSRFLKPYFVCFFLLVLTDSSSWGEVTKIYKSPFYNLQINFPETWVVEDSKHILQFKHCYLVTKSDYISKGGCDRNSVRVTVLVRNKSSNDYIDFEELKNFNKNCKKCRIWDEGQVTIDNLNAAFYAYFQPAVSKREYVKTFRIFRGSEIYDLSYIAPIEKFDEYLPMAEEIIRSIKILE